MDGVVHLQPPPLRERIINVPKERKRHKHIHTYPADVAKEAVLLQVSRPPPSHLARAIFPSPSLLLWFLLHALTPTPTVIHRTLPAPRTTPGAVRGGHAPRRDCARDAPLALLRGGAARYGQIKLGALAVPQLGSVGSSGLTPL